MVGIGCLFPFVLLIVGAALGGVLGGTNGGIWGGIAGFVVGLVFALLGLKLFERARNKIPD